MLDSKDSPELHLSWKVRERIIDGCPADIFTLLHSEMEEGRKTRVQNRDHKKQKRKWVKQTFSI